jgi:hypothetical protein
VKCRVALLQVNLLGLQSKWGSPDLLVLLLLLLLLFDWHW